ncbi:hypothetical protein R69746_04100 [Paraburkholderia aspalathi]|nr:hypothetical protein R69746_04100 [Paraburkholderia aspalathi]
MERHVLIRLRVEQGVARTAQQSVERQCARERNAHHDRIDEVADRAFGGGVASAIQRHADADIGLPAVAIEQRGEGGHQRHRQRDAVVACKVAGARDAFGRQAPRDASTGRRACRVATGTRQNDFRACVAELRAPIGELFVAARGAQDTACVLDAGEIRGSLGAGGRLASFVALKQRLDDQLERPRVGDDVMHCQLQHMLVRPHTHERGAQQGVLAKIEGRVRNRDQMILEMRLAARGIERRDVGDVPVEARRRAANLMRHAVVFVEAHPQRVVTRADLREGVVQSRCVECAARTQRTGHVIRGARRIELPLEVETFLGRRQWERRAGRDDAGMRAGGVGLHKRCGRGARVLLCQPTGLQRNCTCLENESHGGYHAECLADPRGQSCGFQRVAAEIEEVVVDADPCVPEDGLPYPGQTVLQR